MFNLQLFRSAPLALAIALTSTIAHAEAVAAEDQQQDIIVNGVMIAQSRAGTKTDTPLRDVPQAISVVSRQQIDDQAIRSVAELVHLVPGVSGGQGEGHRDQITLRGVNTTADFFVDGLRDDAQHFRTFYNVDRVEILKGANAMIFGRGGGGGVVNRVLKTADSGGPITDFSASVDQFGAFMLTADIGQPLGGGGFRFNGMVETLDNHRDFVGGSRFAFNPTVALPFAGGRLDVGYEHNHEQRSVDRGVPSLAGRPLTGFDDTFFGDPRANSTTFDNDVVRARGVWALSPSLEFNAQALAEVSDKGYANAYPSSAVRVEADGRRTVEIGNYSDTTARRTAIAQGNLVWRGETGAIGHTLLLGAEYTRQATDSERVNGFFDDGTAAGARSVRVTLAERIALPALRFIAGPAIAGNRASRAELDQWSVYAQDQLRLFGDALQIIGGVRYDRFDLSVRNQFTGSSVNRVDDLLSPRIGVVVKPAEPLSLYASWGRSWLPQSGDQFNSLDATLATLEPERFDNLEIGAKWSIAPGLEANAALFELERSNSRAAGPTPGTIVLTGRQRVRGGEVSVGGRIARGATLFASYGYTDARVVAGDNNGRRVAQAPEHTLSLWGRAALNDRLSLGAGVIHQSDSFTSISNAVLLPAYTRVDAAAYVSLTRNLELQVNVDNLFDVDHFPQAHSDNNITPGAPRSARVTLRWRG